MISAIVSVDSNWAIGADNKLVVRNPIDMAFFCGITQGKTLIAGYNTFNSLPKLKNRWVVCDTQYEESMELVRHNNLMIIGGEKTYKKYAYCVNELFLTINDVHVEEADAFFPIKHYQHLSNKQTVFKGEYEGMGFVIQRWTA